jgi:CRAL/TRIO domain
MHVDTCAGKAAKLGNLASKVSEHHYPDRLHRALLINCPGMINQMWGVVKNMLDKNARDRTSLYTKGDSLTVRLCCLSQLYAV